MKPGNHLIEMERSARKFAAEGKLQEAAHSWSELLRLEPDWEHGHGAYALACCLEDLGQIDAAREAYLRALSHDPANRVFLGAYSSFLLLHGTPQAAFDSHMQLLSLELAAQDATAAAATRKVLFDLGRKAGFTEQMILDRLSANK